MVPNRRSIPPSRAISHHRVREIDRRRAMHESLVGPTKSFAVVVLVTWLMTPTSERRSAHLRQRKKAREVLVRRKSTLKKSFGLALSLALLAVSPARAYTVYY